MDVLRLLKVLRLKVVSKASILGSKLLVNELKLLIGVLKTLDNDKEGVYGAIAPSLPNWHSYVLAYGVFLTANQIGNEQICHLWWSLNQRSRHFYSDLSPHSTFLMQTGPDQRPGFKTRPDGIRGRDRGCVIVSVLVL